MSHETAVYVHTQGLGMDSVETQNDSIPIMTCDVAFLHSQPGMPHKGNQTVCELLGLAFGLFSLSLILQKLIPLAMHMDASIPLPAMRSGVVRTPVQAPSHGKPLASLGLL